MINLLVTLNSGYIKPLTVMLYSLMKSNPDEQFRLFVAHSSLTQADFEAIGNSIDSSRTTVEPITVSSELLNDAPILDRISKETYYRLLAIKYMPQDVEKVLYIDPDTLVINSITEFYSTELGEKYYAGAGHTYGAVAFYNRHRLRMNKGDTYINAGILLMNLKAMRKAYTVEQIFDFIKKNQKKLYLADQDVLNMLYGSNALCLDPCLINCDEKTCVRFCLTVNKVKAETLIIHFNGKYKPWKPKYVGIMKCFWDEYESELRGQSDYVIR